MPGMIREPVSGSVILGVLSDPITSEPMPPWSQSTKASCSLVMLSESGSQ